MTRGLSQLAGLFAAVVAVCLASAASARCTVRATNVSTLSFNTGTYTPPAAPVAQLLAYTVSGTYNTDNDTSAPLCTVGISFNRASLPASMARSGGGATLPYTIQTLPGGGNTVLFTGGGNPTAAQLATASFSQAGTNLTNVPFSVLINLYFLVQPGSPQREGAYTDAPVLNAYNVRQGTGALSNRATGTFNVSGTVAKACTIGGVASPAIDTANIPVNAAGVVDTSVIARSYLTVVCNALTNLQATSTGGGVKRAAAAPGGFSHIINYTAVATFGGATSTVNTATVGTAVAAEAGSIGTTSAATSSGTLGVTITPQTPGQPLVSGSYSDVLRIQLTPQ